MAGNKRPICPQCADVEMTPQEEEKLRGKMCYWCYVDYVKARNAAADTAHKPLPPEDFGRTVAEFQKGRPGKDTALGYHSASAGFVPDPGQPPFSPEAQEMLKTEFGLDVNKPQFITRIRANGSEGTSLTLELTAPVTSAWRDAIEQMLNMELENIVKILMYGPKHPKMLPDLNSRLNPGPPQFGGFNPGD